MQPDAEPVTAQAFAFSYSGGDPAAFRSEAAVPFGSSSFNAFTSDDSFNIIAQLDIPFGSMTIADLVAAINNSPDYTAFPIDAAAQAQPASSLDPSSQTTDPGDPGMLLTFTATF